MGKKYTIELLDECNSEFKGIMAFGLTQEKQISVELIPEEGLTPYTEPDMEQVRKEAYEQGLSDAWETVKELFSFTFDEQATIFKTTSVRDTVRKYSAYEAIEKIRQYEQRQEEQIRVGDEVITASGKAVVTGVGPVHFEYVYADGSHGYDKVKNVKKTGRHFPEIAATLEKMREGQEQ